MCSPSIPDPPPPPPPKPDFRDEEIALATEVEGQRRNRRLAGLSSTISGAASGVLSPTRTTAGIKQSKR